jgi:hypothetical protein
VSSEEPPSEPGAALSQSEDASQPAPDEPPGRPLPVGRLVLGLVLVGIGVIWLLQALDVVSFSLLAVLPAALILVGVALIAMAQTRRHGGLVTLGIVLTVILTIASGFDIRLEGGVGDRTERPTTLGELQREYHLSVGQLVNDLRNLELPASTTINITASVGLGQLTVRVPTAQSVQLVGHAGAGQVTAFGREANGLDASLSYPGGLGVVGNPRSAHISLDLSVGLGGIEVTR